MIAKSGYRLVAFDLDDTLTVSKSQIDPRMADLLGRLLVEVEVCIISGGRFEQFETQVLRFLPDDPTLKARLHLMPTCGTRYYRWVDGEWHLVYAEDFNEAQKKQIIDVLVAGAQELGLWRTDTWGDIIEDRGSQITFSALGQSAPPDEKYRWDPDGTKREALRGYAAQRLPDLEIRSGGSTSVDITKLGVDKAYGMRKLMAALSLAPEQLLFVGDRLDVGGNDYPVKEMGLDTVAVTSWKDTADYVQRLVEPAESAPAG